MHDQADEPGEHAPARQPCPPVDLDTRCGPALREPEVVVRPVTFISEDPPGFEDPMKVGRRLERGVVVGVVTPRLVTECLSYPVPVVARGDAENVVVGRGPGGGVAGRSRR
jgi:hypothetical protein